MANEDVTPTPTPVAASAAPDIASPDPATSIPDVGGMVSNTMAQMAPFQAKEQAATQKAADLANQPVSGPPPPHARLLAMVNGLALGLSSFGTAIATHGEEGGAKEVTQVRGEQQQQKIQAQQAAQAQRNAQIQNQLMVADTNHKLAQNVLLMATLRNELTKSALEVSGMVQAQKGEGIRQTGEEQTQAIQGAEFAAQYGMSPTDYKAALSSNQPAGTVNGIFTTKASQQLQAAAAVLGSKDPYVQRLQSLLTDGKATPSELVLATNAVRNQQQLQSAATDELVKKEAASQGLRAKDLNDATGRYEQAQQAYKANPTPENKTALDDAKATQSGFLSIDRQQKQMAQDIQNGDPTIIGESMAQGLYAPSQVLSARSMSKPFYSKVIAAANEYNHAHGLPDFNAAAAEGQYKYATNVQTQNTLNKIRTLNEPGGDLDILKDVTAALPRMDSQTVNKIFNATATEFGSSEATNYHMALYNLAGLLAQVQTGSIPTEGEIQQQLNLMKAASSQGQLDGAISVARRDIGARGRSMVGSNPFLKAAYPDLNASNQASSTAAPAGSPASKVHTNLTDFAQHYAGTKGEIYSDDGRTWYDATGNLVK